MSTPDDLRPVARRRARARPARAGHGERAGRPGALRHGLPRLARLPRQRRRRCAAGPPARGRGYDGDRGRGALQRRGRGGVHRLFPDPVQRVVHDVLGAPAPRPTRPSPSGPAAGTRRAPASDHGPADRTSASVQRAPGDPSRPRPRTPPAPDPDPDAGTPIAPTSAPTSRPPSHPDADADRPTPTTADHAASPHRHRPPPDRRR